MEKKEYILLKYASLHDLINKTSHTLDEFLLKSKTTRGRELRSKLREMRNICNALRLESIEYENQIKVERKNKKEENEQD